MRNGYAHRVLDELIARVRASHAERAERLAALRTRDDALAYQAAVREAIGRAFRPLPEPLPVLALNAEATGEMERPGSRARRGFTLRKVRFESRPGLWITANLYIPHDLRGPAPAVLGACGHSEEGKAEPLYQHFCQWLARCGFVVLIYDPLNQGERDQYALLGDREMVRACTSAHNMMGKQLELLGENLAAWRAWDGMRALDYLLAQPEVDPRRVGVTGNSGGGTMSTWLWAVEPRLTMAAPSCFITTFLRNLENELPADAEQYPPGVVGAGLEMADFLIARAPQPALLLGQRYDFFDRRGFFEARDEIARFYRLLGATAHDEPYGPPSSPPSAARDSRPASLPAFGWYLGPHPHGFRQENQAAMVRFFAQHAGLARRRRSRATDEFAWVEEARPELADLFDPRDLWATEQGSVVLAGSAPIYELIAARAEELAAEREAEREAAPLGSPALSETTPRDEPEAPSAGARMKVVWRVEVEPHNEDAPPFEAAHDPAGPPRGDRTPDSSTVSDFTAEELARAPAGMFGDLEPESSATPELGGLGSDDSPAGAALDVDAEPASPAELGGLGSDHTPAGVSREVDTEPSSGAALGGLGSDHTPAGVARAVDVGPDDTPELGGLGSDASPAPGGAPRGDPDRDALRAKVARLLRLPEGWAGRPAPSYRVLRPTRLEPLLPSADDAGGPHASDAPPSIVYSRYAVRVAAPDRGALESLAEAILYRRAPAPDQAHTLDVADDLDEDGDLHLYLPHFSSAQDLAADPLALALQEVGPGLAGLSAAPRALYALDVRGLGESAPDEEGPFWQPYGIDYMAHGYAGLLGETFLGWRVLDVLSAIDLLVAEAGARFGNRAEGGANRVEAAPPSGRGAPGPLSGPRVHLVGRGQGAVLAALAAGLHPAVSSVTLKNAPLSYLAWARAPLVHWPAANIAPGVLRLLDLPELYASIQAEIIEPWDERMERILAAD